MRLSNRLVFATAMALALQACQGGSSDASANNVAEDGATTNLPVTQAAALPFFGDGYPANGSPCRRVGESAATVDFLDDSADLVGCPTPKDAEALGGKTLATIDGTVLVSVPRKGAVMAETGDALVAGTDYNATAEIECAGYRGAAAGRCPAGVKRNQEGGVTVVEVKWPNGRSRAIMFKDGKVLSADTSQADGSAKFAVKGERAGDITTVTIGPERYVIPDAFVTGG